MTTDPGGWRPLSAPQRTKRSLSHIGGSDEGRIGGPLGAPEGEEISPFTRLAHVHAISTAGDAFVAVALAGSLFFSIPRDQAQGKVALYLALTVLPFAVVAPLIGPAIDRARGGRRWMIMGSALLRLILCFFMMRDLTSVWLFPEAFLVLVLQKGYQVARAAFVPTTVDTDSDLVEANSKLSLISGLMGFAAVLPAAGLSKLAGAGSPLVLAVGAFAGTAALSVMLPRSKVAEEPADTAEKEELRGAGVLLAASAMALLRAIVGFLTLLLAFDFRGKGHPTWHFGVAAAASVTGALLGSVSAPRLRQITSEENILIGVLAATTLAGLGAFLLGSVGGACLLAFMVGLASTAGRVAFDSIVQRDAPDANRGRSFARFETRFQVAWVAGAFLPVIIRMSVEVGFGVVLLLALAATFSYVVGSTAARHRSTGRYGRAGAAAVEIEERINSVQAAAGQRVRVALRVTIRRTFRRPDRERTVADLAASPAEALTAVPDPPPVDLPPPEPSVPSAGPEPLWADSPGALPLPPPPEPTTPYDQFAAPTLPLPPAVVRVDEDESTIDQ